MCLQCVYVCVCTGGSEELLSRAQDDVTVSVSTEEKAEQCSSVRHTDLHALIQEILQLLSRTHIDALLRLTHTHTHRLFTGIYGYE